MNQKDIESQLRDKPLQTGRALHRDFTKTIVSRIDDGSSGPGSMMLNVFIRRIIKMNSKFSAQTLIIAAVVIGVAALGGTAYAISKGWPQARSAVASEISTKDDKKLYTVVSTDCISTKIENIYQQVDWNAITPSNHLTKFEVESGTKVDPKDMEQMALAICNDGASMRQLDTTLKTVSLGVTPADKKLHYNNARIEVASITDTTVQGKVQAWEYDDAAKNTKIVTYDRTYALDPDMKAYNYDTVMSTSEIKAGDSLDMLLYSENMPEYQGTLSDGLLSKSKKAGMQQGVSAVAVIKTPKYTTRFEAIQNLIDKYGDKVHVESSGSTIL